MWAETWKHELKLFWHQFSYWIWSYFHTEQGPHSMTVLTGDGPIHTHAYTHHPNSFWHSIYHLGYFNALVSCTLKSSCLSQLSFISSGWVCVLCMSVYVHVHVSECFICCMCISGTRVLRSVQKGGTKWIHFLWPITCDRNTHAQLIQSYRYKGAVLSISLRFYPNEIF